MLSLTSKYAIKALIKLADLNRDSYVQVKELGKLSKVPAPYLSKIIKQLAAKGLVDAKRGPNGGIRLHPNQGQLNFYQICLALDEPAVTSSCFLSKEPCSQNTPCPMHNRWSAIKATLIKFLQDSKIPSIVRHIR